MPYNKDKTVFKTSPTEKNCSKKTPTASIPFDAEPLALAGKLKRIEVWDCVEQKLYVFDALVAVQRLKAAFYNRYNPPKFAVLHYKKVPQLFETEPVIANVTLELSHEEAALLRQVLHKLGDV